MKSLDPNESHLLVARPPKWQAFKENKLSCIRASPLVMCNLRWDPHPPTHTQFIHTHEEIMTPTSYVDSMKVECSRNIHSINVSDYYVLHLKKQKKKTGHKKISLRASWEHLNNYLNILDFCFSLFFLHLACHNFSVHDYRMNTFLWRKCWNFTKFWFFTMSFFFSFRVFSIF